MENSIKSRNTISITTEYGRIERLVEADEMWSLWLLCDNWFSSTAIGAKAKLTAVPTRGLGAANVAGMLPQVKSVDRSSLNGNWPLLGCSKDVISHSCTHRHFLSAPLSHETPGFYSSTHIPQYCSHDPLFLNRVSLSLVFLLYIRVTLVVKHIRISVLNYLHPYSVTSPLNSCIAERRGVDMMILNR